MAALKCKKCGGDLEIIPDSSICECQYCGSKETIPTVDDEKILRLYDRANRLRFANEFDNAESVYENIIQESDTEAEAYWGIILCKYGIEYVDDPVSGEKIPTCHRLSFDSVMEDSNFDLVMENSDMISRGIYRENAKQIEEIRKGIIEVSEKEEPYDIFICYKEADDKGDRTVDSVIAQEVYDELTRLDYRVFFSRISLEDKIGQEFEPYIFAALTSAKVMLAFGTSYEYYNSVWVKNEWGRFLKLMSIDRGKHLIPCFKGIDAYDIPKEFKHLQAQDMGKVGAVQDLIRGINKILRPDVEKKRDVVTIQPSGMAPNSSVNTNALLERGFISIEDKEFQKADHLFEEVLNHQPKCAIAYVGKLQCLLKAKDIEDVASILYEKIFIKTSLSTLELDYDIIDLVKKNYFGGGDIPDRYYGKIKKVVDERLSVEEDVEQLRNFDREKNYFDHRFDNKAHIHFQRFLQYASQEEKNTYDVNGALEKKVKVVLSKLDERLAGLDKDTVLSITEEANHILKMQLGDDYDRIENEYRVNCDKAHMNNENKRISWEDECKRRKENWPEVRAEIRKKWELDCERIQKEYEETVRRVNENNEPIMKKLDNANLMYKEYMDSIRKRKELLECSINIPNKRISSRKLNKIQLEIKDLEREERRIKRPDAFDYGDLIPVPPKPVFPKEPIDSDEPVLPEEPKYDEIPQRESAGVDILEPLRKSFLKKGMKIWEKAVMIGKYKGVRLVWNELDTDESGNSFLLSDSVLDYISMESEYKNSQWYNCKTRQWLNDSFYNDAFDDSVKKHIIAVDTTTDVINEFYEDDEFKRRKHEKGEETEDKVFLLSLEEVKKYFSCDGDKIDENDLYLIPCDDEYRFDKSFNSAWWLRTKKNNVKDAPNEPANEFYCCVYTNGEISKKTQKAILGVRPAMWYEKSDDTLNEQ